MLANKTNGRKKRPRVNAVHLGHSFSNRSGKQTQTKSSQIKIKDKFDGMLDCRLLRLEKQEQVEEKEGKSHISAGGSISLQRMLSQIHAENKVNIIEQMKVVIDQILNPFCSGRGQRKNIPDAEKETDQKGAKEQGMKRIFEAGRFFGRKCREKLQQKPAYKNPDHQSRNIPKMKINIPIRGEIRSKRNLARTAQMIKQIENLQGKQPGKKKSAKIFAEEGRKG